ncbi:MAG: helix-turn-helix domain-containing protein [Hydrococcus sp. RU_2_2]|nr:helix-turn-helix domain-containing protein [Hydrococcus sp. RU_2_2]NJQ97098.1 helix-turn-helix domain-containing protein [Hydrococcus sp. CSU_1_8]
MSIGYLSVKETAEILGYSEQYVRKLLRSGDLSGETIGNRWIIASESASEYHCKSIAKIHLFEIVQELLQINLL